ncbi:MAG: HNH endonuclease [Chloroflexi bacterium CFX4]|nr:HNH endonuclease [Chloroflexi bacterium CFX4]MDL1920975.1 HNH endonuclease [Chloroflexi bacterium CFX3]
MHVEHIDPDGGDAADNLCLACPSCNLSKGRATTAIDPLTGDPVALFNPRAERWEAHFQWSSAGDEVIGITSTGRATVVRLKMNQARLMAARRIWVQAGVHPPNGLP